MQAQAAQQRQQMAGEVQRREVALRDLEAERDNVRADLDGSSQRLADSQRRVEELEARCREAAGLETEV